MKTIKIKSLSLLNFKGIRKLQITDFGKETNIFGDNGTGKTTIFDAFTWLLFGKDSQDRSAFEIKTLDKDNNIIPQIEHEVSAILEIDGEIVEVKRTLREKWVTKKGSSEPEFSGNETNYTWNDVPMLAKDFSKKIEEIIDEKVFKMITNPLAFNTLKWQDQRQVLMNISGGVTDEEIAKQDPDFGQLLSKLTNKSLEEYKKQVAAQLKKSKSELKIIPTRIDEVERGKPEELDFDAISGKLEEKQKALSAIDDQISDELKAQQALIDTKSRLKTEIQQKDFKISDIRHEYRQKALEEYRAQNSEQDVLNRNIATKESEIRTAENLVETLQTKANSKQSEEETISSKMDSLRGEFDKINAESFSMDEGDTECPTCKREFDEDKLEELKSKAEATYKSNQLQRRNDINQRGSSLKKTLEATVKERQEFQSRIEKGNAMIETLKGELSELKAKNENLGNTDAKSEDDFYNELLSQDTKIKEIQGEISKLTEQLENIGGVNVDGLKSTKSEINVEISNLKTQLQAQEQIKKANERIDQLLNEEKTLAQQIADVEKEQFVIDNFTKAKIDRLEMIINQKFEYVNFKMFETQINGGEVETCKALINGVPFSDANTASKINAGVDIINTLSQYYSMVAPIFIDNRESVIELVPSRSQIINLIVSEADEKLRVVAHGVEELETA